MNAPQTITLPAVAARLFAIEILLADPEALGDDVLESCLYLRDRLLGKEDDDQALPASPGPLPDPGHDPLRLFLGNGDELVAVRMVVEPWTVTEDDIWDVGAISAFFAISNRLARPTKTMPNDEFYLMGRLPRPPRSATHGYAPSATTTPPPSSGSRRCPEAQWKTYLGSIA